MKRDTAWSGVCAGLVGTVFVIAYFSALSGISFIGLLMLAGVVWVACGIICLFRG